MERKTEPVMEKNQVLVQDLISWIQRHFVARGKRISPELAAYLQLQLKYMELIQALFCEVNPIPVKKALELMGFQTKYLRMPLTEMEEKNLERLKKAMEIV